MACEIDMLHPAIVDGWYQRFIKRIPEYRTYRVRAVLAPPVCITLWTGKGSVTMGYDPVSQVDFGQNYEVPRGGDAEDAQDWAQACADAGMEVRLDIPHQFGVDGDNPPYPERNAAGVYDRTLAWKPVAMFTASGDRSKVFDESGSRGMGQRVNYWVHIPGIRDGYALNLWVQTTGYLQRCFGSTIGPRIDNGKDEEVRTLQFWARHFPGAVAEVMDGDPQKHLRFVQQTGLKSYDFPFYYVCRDVTNGAPMSDLFRRQSLWMLWPERAIGFAENHDTDGPNGIVRLKLLVYMLLATLPMSRWMLYWGDDERYGLWPKIKHWVWIHEVLAFGSFAEAYADNDVAMWTRDGNGGHIAQSGGLMCGFSRDPFNTRWVWAYHPVWRNESVVNYAPSGGPAVWVNEWGWGCYPLPSNEYDRADNGIAYSRPGQGKAIKGAPRKVKLANPYDYSSITARIA